MQQFYTFSIKAYPAKRFFRLFSLFVRHLNNLESQVELGLLKIQSNIPQILQHLEFSTLFSIKIAQVLFIDYDKANPRSHYGNPLEQQNKLGIDLEARGGLSVKHSSTELS